LSLDERIKSPIWAKRACRSVRSRSGWGGRHRRSAVRFVVTRVLTQRPTDRSTPIVGLSTGGLGRASHVWPATRCCASTSRPGSRRAGALSRSHTSCAVSSRTCRPDGCAQRRGGFQRTTQHRLCRDERSEACGGGVPAECLAWSGVELSGHQFQVRGGVHGQVGALGEPVAQQPVRCSRSLVAATGSAGQRSRPAGPGLS